MPLTIPPQIPNLPPRPQRKAELNLSPMVDLEARDEGEKTSTFPMTMTKWTLTNYKLQTTFIELDREDAHEAKTFSSEENRALSPEAKFPLVEIPSLLFYKMKFTTACLLLLGVVSTAANNQQDLLAIDEDTYNADDVAKNIFSLLWNGSNVVNLLIPQNQIIIVVLFIMTADMVLIRIIRRLLSAFARRPI